MAIASKRFTPYEQGQEPDVDEQLDGMDTVPLKAQATGHCKWKAIPIPSSLPVIDCKVEM